MRNKGILSLVAVGLFASSLSVGTVNAEGNENELMKKAIEGQVEKPLPKGLVDSATLDQLQVEIKGSAKSSNKISRMSSSSDSDYTLETEYNDDFDSANRISFEETTIGQLLPLYDVDIYKVVVPRSGLLLIAGVTDSYAIDLGFVAVQKDFVENSNLEYLGNEYDDSGVEVRAYQAKAGTYYVGVFDHDNEYDIDDNTEEDLYAIKTVFVDNVKPSKPSVNKVDNNDKVIVGKAEANSTVTVKSGSKVLGSAKATSKGTFSINIAVQKAGTKLTITAKDSSGNVSSSVSVTVLDVVPPSKPTVSKVDNNDKVVTGKAEANSTVTVKNGSKALGSAKATTKGTYSIKIAVQKAGTKLTVTAKDSSGNVSSSASVTVLDVVPPSKPTVSKVDDNDKVVKGKAEASSTVTVKVGSISLGSAKATSNGSYSVKIKAQKKGTTLSITAKDKAGNVSSKATTKVVKH
ncbi:Ig-like domain-containing protein [Peribacillus butanolivorans]|uniref:Ig-like domain-containing protein n=1 Tax=Peribacillus butanolivorans TaxID=421767 RepID=UPI00207C5A11|nr:Ig-like domain-containing protein [Peribacillus butanolivorans]MCO0600719.1 Ig-like domain-containing protein [Peribacillus butanolivorans]